MAINSPFPQINSPPQSAAEVLVNEALETLKASAVYGKKPSTTSGLVWGYYGGRWGGFSVADGTFTLGASTTTYVVVALATGVITASTSATNWNDASNYARAYKLTTSASAITGEEDHRAGPGGVYGGGGSGGSVTSWKTVVRAATTANGTLASAFANGSTFDGVTLATGDRILLKNQTSGSENGVYIVNASGAPTRATDADQGSELVDAVVPVSEGTANADTVWICTTNAPITPGTTSLTFAGFGVSAFTGGTLTGALNEATPVTIASAGTMNIGAAAANTINVSGTTGITAFDSIAAGAKRTLVFAGALTITHNGTSLQNLTSANITTAAGDVAEFESLGSGNWKMTDYVRKAGTALVGSGATFLYASNVWIDASGNDGTAVVGNPNLPFATIAAGLDASTGPTVLHLGIGAFPFTTHDGSSPASTTLNGSSKLRSDLWFRGAKKPALDSYSAPTQLVNGSVVQGGMRIHSTRNNVRFSDLGVDAGSVVCGALYSGTAQDGLFFNNVTQTAALAGNHGIRVDNVISLCKAATSAVHAMGVENCIDPQISSVESYFGIHGFAWKSKGGYLNGLISYGHANDVIVFKDGGGNLDVAPCRDASFSNIVGGALGVGDTPYGLVFDAGYAAPKRLAIVGVALTGISSYEIQSNNSGGSANPCLTAIRIDNFFTDNGTIRTSYAANTDTANIFINATGTTGATGATGAAGATGATGANGTNGTNGAAGATGATGAAGASSSAGPSGVAGRLTLVSGSPVADATAASTLYWTPYKGNQIQLWDGSAWTTYTSGELSLALGTMTASIGYDVFMYQNAGTPTLEKLAWTSASARATAVTWQDGRLCKSGDKTRLLVGSFYARTTTTIDDNQGGTTSRVGGHRDLWNAYNRVEKAVRVIDTDTAGYSYTTQTIRQAGGQAGNKVEAFVGYQEDAANFQACSFVAFQATSAPSITSGVGINKTNGYDGIVSATSGGSSGTASPVGWWRGLLPLGYSYVSWNEKGTAATYCVFYGADGNGVQAGLHGSVFA